jgi:hypothetical protein
VPRVGRSNLTAPNSMILFFSGSIPVVSMSREMNMVLLWYCGC